MLQSLLNYYNRDRMTCNSFLENVKTVAAVSKALDTCSFTIKKVTSFITAVPLVSGISFISDTLNCIEKITDFTYSAFKYITKEIVGVDIEALPQYINELQEKAEKTTYTGRIAESDLLEACYVTMVDQNNKDMLIEGNNPMLGANPRIVSNKHTVSPTIELTENGYVANGGMIINESYGVVMLNDGELCKSIDIPSNEDVLLGGENL